MFTDKLKEYKNYTIVVESTLTIMVKIVTFIFKFHQIITIFFDKDIRTESAIKT